MTHPTNTAILSDKQRKEFIRRAGFISEADRDMRTAFVDEIAAAVIEKLATGGAVPADLPARIKASAAHWAYLAEIDHGDAVEVEKQRHAEMVDSIATALAAARQQGRNEGREEARAELAPAAPAQAEWMTCGTRRPWATNSLKARAEEMRAAGKRCRNAYRKDYMGVMARYVADAFDEAARAFETRLAAIDAARQPTQKEA